ncbi:plastocyanin/azurin family copper-binding protein [Allobranchiibius sp. GilTou73]|uniref:plastocyanin/azurin family copper-binding protein n=1 Tax=Allobranchiibius sp. GilTou73 TaxID=2904523 RepID=UPI001F46C4CE|nr:plastocyanin/azurin family copper-binding protein [Allobranchiibius sp. GilTou73]UIJ33880.1 plastocyanin/azurin family copper-binding protein [Allobranchiibius sp. GilTou73]
MTFTPGTYTFDVKNGGSATHALKIVGPGVDKSTSDIAAGKSATLTVTLTAGTYDVNCPVANHKMLGMDVKIKVA